MIRLVFGGHFRISDFAKCVAGNGADRWGACRAGIGEVLLDSRRAHRREEGLEG
jgi:hypothetical protein